MLASAAKFLIGFEFLSPRLFPAYYFYHETARYWRDIWEGAQQSWTWKKEPTEVHELAIASVMLFALGFILHPKTNYTEDTEWLKMVTLIQRGMHWMTAIWCDHYLLAPVTWGYNIPFFHSNVPGHNSRNKKKSRATVKKCPIFFQRKPQ